MLCAKFVCFGREMKGKALEKIISETVDIPSLPAVAAKVMKLMDSEYASVDELEGIIQVDQALSTRLLRIANSAYYLKGRRIDSVSSAIIQIGFKTMKSLVVATSIKDIHRKFGLFEQKLWEHGLGVSIAASMIAKETRMASADEALVAGLIHDVGKTVLNNSMSETYALVVEKVYGGEVSFVDAENEMLDFNHCSVGGFVARKWKLPKNLEVVIEYHHSDSIPAHDEGVDETLCQIVKVADALCLNLGIGFQNQNVPIDIESIGLTEERLEELKKNVEAAYSEQKADLLGST